MHTRLMTAMMMAAGFAGGANGAIQRFDLDPNALPSAQGWSYFSTNLEEGEAIWLDEEGVMSLNTIGSGDLSEVRFDRFLTPDTFTGVTEVRVRTRLRVLDYESFGGPTEGVGLSLIGVADGARAGLGFDGKSALAQGGDAVFIDVSSWHTYDVRVDTATRAMRLSVDGVLVMTGLAPEDDSTFLQIVEGFRVNVHAEIASARWTLIPAPSTAPALALGAILCARRRR